MIVTVSCVVADPTYLVVGENQRWQGEVELTQPILVAAGATLELAPGTRISSRSVLNRIRVEGALLALGTEQQPIQFLTPPDWQGIELTESLSPSRFVQVEIASAKTAISSTAGSFQVVGSQFVDCDIAIKLHRQSQPQIESSLFTGNRLAIDIEMRSQAVVRNNRFTGNKTAILASHNSSGQITGNSFADNEQGVRIQHLFPGQISGNRFVSNGKGLICDQTMESPQIIDNRFIDNQQGLVSLLASKPLVRNNMFRGNRQALFNNQLGSPRVRQNLFIANQIAIDSERRSAPQIELNRFERNELALHCDYLSYPLIRQNNFTGNRMAVKLGEHQSADMEKQGKAQPEMQQVLADSGRSGKMAIFPPAAGIVDVRDNWWGGAAPDLEEGAVFYDRKLAQWVVDDNSGQRYLRDQIEFTPWLTKPVANAGLE